MQSKDNLRKLYYILRKYSGTYVLKPYRVYSYVHDIFDKSFKRNKERINLIERAAYHDHGDFLLCIDTWPHGQALTRVSMWHCMTGRKQSPRWACHFTIISLLNLL